MESILRISSQSILRIKSRLGYRRSRKIVVIKEEGTLICTGC
jgi:hypothetical protein